ncbi:hypothetical protein ACHQM5_022760 [Ranunculus cassubicifolius]
MNFRKETLFSDDMILMETSAPRLEKRFSRRTPVRKVGLQAESGTCTACVAPCSSCGRIDQAVSSVEQKGENEFSGELPRKSLSPKCSFIDAKMMPSPKKRAHTVINSATSDTSNCSASSSHDSVSKNPEIKSSPRTSITNGDAELLIRDSSSEALASDQDVHALSNCDVACDAGQRPVENNFCVQNGSNSDDVNVDTKTISCNLASPSSSLPQKTSSLQPDSESLCCSQIERKDNCNLEVAAISGAHMSNSLGSEDVSPGNSKSSSQKISETSVKDNSYLEGGIDVETEEPAAKSVDHLEVKDQIEKSSLPLKTVNDDNSPLESHSDDVTDESNNVDDDVKICDICGDAGREDLLAICSRCSDGAEHTYCMRIMMDTVPEGDWICEGCQLKEEDTSQKKNNAETVSETLQPSSSNERIKKSKSVRTLDSKISPKSETQFSDEEVNKATKVAPSPRTSSKRPSEDLESPPASKRPALVSGVGSPKPSSPRKANTLSRETSFKNLDKGKVKPVHAVPTFSGSSSHNTERAPTTSLQNSSKIRPSPQSPRGTFLKSSSFSTSTSKSKVKLVQEEAHQKNKLSKHPSRKEGPVRTYGKSSSFSMGSSHSNSVEAKTKIHTSHLSRVDDISGKFGKEQNTITRKNSFKSDPLVSPKGSNASSPRDEQRVSIRGEHMPLASTTKLRDLKAVQADVRSSMSPKSTNLPSIRESDITDASSARGDFKRQSSLISRGGGYASVNGNSGERKQSKVDPVDEIADSVRPSRGEVYGPEAVDLNAVASSDENQQNVSSPVSVLSRLVSIPEQDYIWQGGFDVQKSGRRLDTFDGIQAHLSTSASPKVLEVANKLPHNVQLEEVSRSSIWPIQFQKCATEDNIALYFFAKDVESYVRSYQSLVENMMKNDLALKAILNGIELLIFPSNQLCEKSKRWNMFYFLWGVFRAKKPNISEQRDPPVKICAANLNVNPMEENISSSIAVTPDNSSSRGNINEDVLSQGNSQNMQESVNATELVHFTHPSSSARVESKNESLDQRYSELETKGEIDLERNPLSPTNNNVQLGTHITGNDTVMLEVKEEIDLERSIQEEKDEDIFDTATKGSDCVSSSSSVQRQETSGPAFLKLYPDEVSSRVTPERFFFTVESHPVGVQGNSVPVEVISSDDDEDNQMESDRPNLDLVLGGDSNIANKRTIRPLFDLLAKEDSNKFDHGKTLSVDGNNKDEDESLSLSLAVKPKPVHNKRGIDAPLLLFPGFPGDT